MNRPRGRLTSHIGEDYAVIMAPGDSTDNALLRVRMGPRVESDVALFMAAPDLLRVATNLDMWLRDTLPEETLRQASQKGYILHALWKAIYKATTKPRSR